MPAGRISKRSVDALTCPNGKDREFLWDDAIAGFGISAFASGKKVYVAQYRQAGRSRRITIGEHGRLTPDEARNEAKKLLGAVVTGADPIAKRQAARAVPLFRQIADEFMRTHVEAKRKARTLDSYETLLRLHILPAIGALRVQTFGEPTFPRCMPTLRPIQARPTGHFPLFLQSGIGPHQSMKTLHWWPTRQRASSATPNKGANDI
jgi:hypothetical protein